MKYTNIKIDLAFITSIYIGYLYLSGRIFLNGMIFNSGNDTPNIGFDFIDYTYEGFMVNLSLPQYVILVAALIYFVFRSYAQKKHYKINFKILFSIINKYLNSQTIDINIIKKQIIREYLKSEKKKKRISLSNTFQNDVIISYLLMIAGLMGLMIFLLKLSDFSSKGQEAARLNTLTSSTYILKDKQKLYSYICGKDKCIYSNKQYNYFFTMKKDEFESFKNQELKVYNSKQRPEAYIIESIKNKNDVEYLIQINMVNKVGSSPNIYDVKLITNLSRNNRHVYTPIKNQIATDLNNINFKLESNIPYFVSFKIPLKENIESISVEKLPSIY